MKALLAAIGFVILAIIIYMYMVRSSQGSAPIPPPTSNPTPLPDLNDDPIIDPINTDEIIHAPSPTPVITPAPSPTPIITPSPAPVITPTPSPVVTQTALSNYRKVINSDIAINDIEGSSFTATSEEACAKACNSLAECSMFAYTTSKGCYPKRAKVDGYGLLAVKRGDGTYNIWNLRDLFGFDIKDYGNITQSQCKQYCDNLADCDIYKYNNGSCWLKSAADKLGVDMYYRKN